MQLVTILPLQIVLQKNLICFLLFFVVVVCVLVLMFYFFLLTFADANKCVEECNERMDLRIREQIGGICNRIILYDGLRIAS